MLDGVLHFSKTSAMQSRAVAKFDNGVSGCQSTNRGGWQRGSLRRPHVRANEDTTFMIMLIHTH